jgi:hypothetical protein
MEKKPMSDKQKCRFHPDGRCPKKDPRMAPAPLIRGALQLNNKGKIVNGRQEFRLYSSAAIVRYARMKSDFIKLNSEWTLWYEKVAIRLIRFKGDLGVIISNFNPRFYSPEETLKQIQFAINFCKTDEDVWKFLAIEDRPGVG